MRYFSSPFSAYVQNWQYSDDGSMSLNPKFMKVFLRGQPSARISLDVDSVERDEEVQVLAWSGEWILIRKENPLVEGWLRAKYRGGWTNYQDFELLIQRWWLMVPSTSPHIKIHFQLSELRANYRM